MTVETTAVITEAGAPIRGHIGGTGDLGRVTAYLEIDDFRILLGRSMSNADKRTFLRSLAFNCEQLSDSLPADKPTVGGVR